MLSVDRYWAPNFNLSARGEVVCPILLRSFIVGSQCRGCPQAIVKNAGTSKAARRRCHQRRPPSRGPEFPPHPRLAASSLAPYPGRSHRTHPRPVGPQISFLTDDQIWTRFNPTGDLLTDLSLEVGRRLKYWDAMRYFFHIFDGSRLFPDDVGNNLPSLEYAKQMAEVVADELKKGGEFCRSSLVIVSDEKGKKLFECGAS